MKEENIMIGGLCNVKKEGWKKGRCWGESQLKNEVGRRKSTEKREIHDGAILRKESSRKRGGCHLGEREKGLDMLGGFQN